MARRRKKSDGGNLDDVGRVMTVSLFLILLTFFILLNSIAVLDERRVRLSLGSLIGAFGGSAGKLSPVQTGELTKPPSPTPGEWTLGLQQLIMDMPDGPVMGEISIQSIPGGTLVSIAADLLFSAKPIRLSPVGEDLLARLAAYGKEKAFPVEIIGHTDRASVEKGGYRSDWELTARMAMQVHGFLIDPGGMSPERIISGGAGDNHPLNPGETPESRARNRRVEILLYHDLPPYLKRIMTRGADGEVTYKKFSFKLY
jgi:chemotaxis protein MotB